MVGMPALERSGYLVNIMSRPGKPIPPNSGDKHTALIIDPDEPSTMVMARTLVLAGFDTRSAAKRHEIVAQLNRQPPVDVIAMDVALPDVIGLELLGRLRAHPIYKAVPIVVMASNVEHDDIVAALAYGASGYMSKPFRPEALLDGIKAVLGLG